MYEDHRKAMCGTAPADAERTIDLVELAYCLLKGWKLILCLALICAAAAGAYSFLLVTPMYEASSTIYVLNRSDSAIDFSDLQIGTALTKDYIKVFQMWEVHEQVISSMKLPYSYDEMQNMIRVTNAADTRMLDITAVSPDPEEAASVSNAYARVASQYIADTMSTDKPNIMSVALVPANPVSPNRTRSILLGFLAGGFTGCAYLLLRQFTDDRYKSAEEIRRWTGLVTLASVPMEDASFKKARGQK